MAAPLPRVEPGPERAVSAGRTRAGTLVAYALLEAPQLGVANCMALFLYPVYADLGIGLGVMGLVVWASRIWDVVTDPLIGWASDRTPGRLGRRRPWILAGAPLLVVAVWSLFLPGEQVTTASFAFWLFVLWLGWTMVAIPYYAWGAELSPDYAERTRIASFRTAFGYAGTLLAVGAPMASQLLFGRGASPAEVLELVGTAALLAIPFAILLLTTRVPERRSPVSAIPLARGVRIMLRNAPFRRLLIGFTLTGLGPALQGPLYIFYVTHVVKEELAGPIVLLVFFSANIPGVLLWGWLANRIEKHRAWMAGIGVMVVATPCYLLLGPGDLLPMMGILFLSGIGAGCFIAVPASMKADVIDLDSIESGEDRAGVFFAAWSMAAKAIGAFGAGIALPVLGWIGFQSRAENPPEVLFALRVFFSGAPMLCYLGGLLLIRGYPITRARHAELRASLSARRA